MFVLASGGVETQGHAFTVETVALHLTTMLGALDRLERHGFAFGERQVDILAVPARATLGDRVAVALGPIAMRKPLEHAYYSGGLRYQLWVTARDGT